jgi:hypothetical protein
MKYNVDTQIAHLRALVRVLWDSEARAWLATSEDVQGLVVEAATFDDVVAEVRALVPELLQLNQQSHAQTVELHFLA